MLPEPLYREARELIAGRLGLDFPEHRRGDLERALLRVLPDATRAAPGEYLGRLAALPGEHAEWKRLASHLTIGETYFFREASCFEALEQTLLPALIAARRAEGVLRLRLWSAGCATGEEPYSLAILLDRLIPDRSRWALTVLATDINLEALEAARRGQYREWAFRGVPRHVRQRHFHRRGSDLWALDPSIRRMVTFAPLNLAEDRYPDVVTNTGAMDVILCRNVLMYFSPGAQRATVARLERALVTGGWLAVSATEASADLLRPLVAVNVPGAIFYRKLAAGGRGSEAWSRAPEATARLDGVGPPPVSPPPPPDARTPPPAPARPTLEQARVLADRGQLEDARRLCEALLARNRLDSEVHLLLGAIDQELGDVPSALAALGRAVYLAPDSAPAHFLMGSLLLRQGKRARGRRCLETVVSLLASVPGGEELPGITGLPARWLLETARDYLALSEEGAGRVPERGAATS